MLMTYRGGARSGLRIDLGSWLEPVVFAPSWKCGDNLIPPKTVACAAEDSADRMSRKLKFFKRDGKIDSETPAADCKRLLREKRDEEPATNVIKPVTGKQAVARVSAAMSHEVFYDAADKSGLFVMGAQHGVSAIQFTRQQIINTIQGVKTIGGWGQAAGHNPLCREYGLQVDQVLEYEVVTADGKFQKVSACSNPELFWALRGGGGGT
jgi:FAD binding domain